MTPPFLPLLRLLRGDQAPFYSVHITATGTPFISFPSKKSRLIMPHTVQKIAALTRRIR